MEPEQNLTRNTDAIINGLSSTAKIVWRILKPDKWITGKDLCEAARLSRRTVYYSLKRLEKLGLIKERGSLEDSRQTYYRRKVESEEAETPPAPKDETAPTQDFQRKRPVSIFDALLTESASKSVVSQAPTKSNKENKPEQIWPVNGLSRQSEKIWNTIRKVGKAVDEDYLQKEANIPMNAVKVALGHLMRQGLVERARSIEDGTTFIYRLKVRR